MAVELLRGMESNVVMAIAAGTYFGRYAIRSLLGTGGMGEVYLAQDTQLDRLVALKILSDHGAPGKHLVTMLASPAGASPLGHIRQS
jgi:hypothetical protein